MAATATTDRDALSREEVRLAGAAAAGDAGAFAELYERYEQRTFNLAYRITGSETDAAEAVGDGFLNAMRRLAHQVDRELNFSAHLFAETHSACLELMQRRPRKPVLDSTAEPQQTKIREASMRLPDRQREALALRGLEELSYEEIAAIMELNPKAVAQLIYRGRINLSDELRGTTLASIGAPSRECGRALPLIAARDDGQLDPGSRDAAWLEAHLANCDRCRLAVDAMRETASSYASWAPVAAPSWLLKETMAKATEVTGTDGSEEMAATASAKPLTRDLSAAPAAPAGGPAGQTTPRAGRPRRRRATLALGLVALVLLAGLGLALQGDNPAPTSAGATAGTTPNPTAHVPRSKRKSSKKNAGRGRKSNGEGTSQKAIQSTAASETLTATSPTGSQAPTSTSGASNKPASSNKPTSHPSRPSGKSGVQSKRPVSPPKHSAKSTPAATPVSTTTPAAQPAPTTTVQAPAPAEETTSEPPRRHEPPGKPADRPPHR